MSEEIKQDLTRLFDRQRIVLWNDRKRELQAEFEGVSLRGMAKITLGNNQFGVKHRIHDRNKSESSCSIALAYRQLSRTIGPRMCS
jgi:hypothetical protein